MFMVAVHLHVHVVQVHGGCTNLGSAQDHPVSAAG
jgi:hypothetical protein